MVHRQNCKTVKSDDKILESISDTDVYTRLSELPVYLGSLCMLLYRIIGWSWHHLHSCDIISNITGATKEWYGTISYVYGWDFPELYQMAQK